MLPFQMTGQHNMKPKKRKTSSETRRSRKVCVACLHETTTGNKRKFVYFFEKLTIWIFPLNTRHSVWLAVTSLHTFNSLSQVSRAGKRCLKSQGTLSKAEGSSVVMTSKTAEPLERLSRISCECHQSAGRRRCSASPDLRGQEGKENELRTEQEFDSCRKNSVWNKQEPEHMDCEETNKIVFPDDDSNQILPVEQFFGNLDIVQVS